MALIRIPVPHAVINGAQYALEFDSDKIVQVETPREVAETGGGRRELSGPNALILRFATLDDAPKWVEPYVPNMDDPGTYVTMTQSEFDEWSKRHGVKWAEPDLAAGVPDAG